MENLGQLGVPGRMSSPKSQVYAPSPVGGLPFWDASFGARCEVRFGTSHMELHAPTRDVSEAADRML